MNAITENWVEIGTVDDIPSNGSRKLLIGETRIAVFRTTEDELFALEDACPHKGGPLSQGIVHGNCVTCPLHNWVISLKSGEATGADEGKTRFFSIKKNAKALLINIAGLEA